MADGKRYYWLKLKDDFFSSKRIKKLRKMAGGDTYTIIYLKMQLLAMKTDGVLTFTGLEENFADEIALDLDESPDDVKVTLAFLISCGLAETSDNVSFFFPYVLENTGSEKAGAERMRKCREKQKMSQCDTPVTPLLQNRDGEIERRERERDRDRAIVRENAPAPAKHKHGEYNNVLLTDEELYKLRAEIPSIDEYIEHLSEYMASTGKPYKSHYATLRNWWKKDKARGYNIVTKERTVPERKASYDIEEFDKMALAVPERTKNE